jgi:homocitrate synthase NifV
MSDKSLSRVVDLTLRDGEQAAGVAFTRAQRLKVARALISTGVVEIEGGIPAMGKEAQADFRALVGECPELRVIAWNRMLRSDVDDSARAGASVVHVSLPVSDAMLSGKLGWERARALYELSGTLAYCKNKGLEVIVGAEDASRAERGFLLEYFNIAREGGAVRLRYADTLGVEDPFTVMRTLGELRRQIALPIEYHAHNDLGLATANALAALSVGCSVSVTVGGIGERAGNASMEQVACAALLQQSLDLGLELPRLPALCELVAELSDRPIPPDRPIVGAMAFTHESGIHVNGFLKREGLYEFVRPELVGRHRSFLPGLHSGASGLKHCAKTLGYDLSQAEVGELRERVRERWSLGAPQDPWAEFASILERDFLHAH